MHKKRIGDKEYFYTSVRDENGKVKTIYLGSTSKGAKKREAELGLTRKKQGINLQLISIIFLSLLLISTGFLAITGFNVLNITEEPINDTLDQIKNNNISEDIIIEETNNFINETPILNETIELNQSEEINLTVQNQTIKQNNTEESLELGTIQEIHIAKGDNNFSEEILNKSDSNSTIEINSTIETIELNQTEEITQYGAVINKPVKWKKKIILNKPIKNISIELPKEATKIEIIKDKETNLITGAATIETELFTTIVDFFSDIFKFTGLVTYEEEFHELNFEEEVTEIEIEYETPAPTSKETQLTENKKQIVISSDVHYTNILAYTEIENTPLESINLYWIIDNNENFEFEGYDTDEDGLVDYIEWVVPHLSDQTFELEINILNVQSYPNVGGEWEVQFETMGTADLTISAINGTTWSNETELEDLKFLTLKCGENSLDYIWTNDKVKIENYSCESAGYETSKVLTQGKHHLEFDFGGLKGYANNFAGCQNITASGSYTLDANISDYNSTNYCININASDVRFDCQGFEIDGADSSDYNLTAINIDNAENVTVKNCIIKDFSYGIYFDTSPEGHALNNTIGYKNGLTYSFKGIGLEFSNSTLVENNTISGFGNSDSESSAISMPGSSNCNITGNEISNFDGDGIFLSLAELTQSDHNLIEDNIINDTLSSIGFAAIRLNDAHNNTINSNDITGSGSCTTNCNYYGIALSNSEENNLTNNNIVKSTEGSIYLYASILNRIEENTLNDIITTTNTAMLYLDASSNNNTIKNNNLTNIDNVGIWLYSSSNYNIINDTSITASSDNDVLAISNSQYNEINNFTSTDSEANGVALYTSTNNTFTDISISGSSYSGVYFSNSSNNTFYNLNSSLNDESGTYGDIAIVGSLSDNEYLINSTFNQSNILFNDSSDADIYVKWYLNVFVNDTNGNLENANVSAWDTDSNLIFTELTNSKGDITEQTITEYYQNSTNSYYLTNYTLNTTKSTHNIDSREINLTSSTDESIDLTILGECHSNITESFNLTSNITACAEDYILTITEDNVVLDCQGYTISGSNSDYGIHTEKDNVTIKNCIIDMTHGNGYHGISAESLTNITLQNNTIDVFYFAINLDKVISSLVTGNNLSSKSYTLQLTSSDDNEINNNTLSSPMGFKNLKLITSDNNEFSDNTLSTGTQNILIMPTSSSNIFRNNNLTISIISSLIEDSSGEGYTNTLIYNNSFGEINWTNTDLDLGNGGNLNLGSNLDITNNNIYVNSTQYSGLNNSANLTLYNTNSLGYENRTPFRNGAECSSDICTELTDADTYTFTVTQFTNYSVGEGTVITPSAGGSGGRTVQNFECTSSVECDKNKLCHENKCITPFDIKIDSGIFTNQGESLKFDYTLIPTTGINGNVKIRYWLETIEEGSYLFSYTKNTCGDGIKTELEECDQGENNTNDPCTPNYDSSCSYCGTDCNLNIISGGYCGDDICEVGETTCKDCEQNIISDIIDYISNLVELTGFVILTEVQEKEIYINGAGTALTKGFELNIPGELTGKYELHIELVHDDLIFETIRLVEIDELTKEITIKHIEEPMLSTENNNQVFNLLLLLAGIMLAVAALIKGTIEIKKIIKKSSQ
ncbi:hypothetical protein HOD61_00130 [archaeon]|nr:hypothetical protein [archaeon]